MSARLPFIARHGLYSEEQTKRAEELMGRAEKEDLHLVRLVWVDSHGGAGQSRRPQGQGRRC